jgi:hypothetical protein
MIAISIEYLQFDRPYLDMFAILFGTQWRPERII